MNVSRGLCVFVSLSGILLSLISPSEAAVGDSFSFAVIADPHCSSDPNGVNARRLRACVDWVNTYQESRDIDLVLVIGDIGTTATTLRTGKSILDGLHMPYVPLVGDNDAKASFASTYGSVYESLSTMTQDAGTGFSEWQRGPVDVYAPNEPSKNLYLENVAFEYRGVSFVCPDWASRADESATLHDFAGGTWDWFKQQMDTRSTGKEENVVVLAHHPMTTFGGILGPAMSDRFLFSRSEGDQLATFLGDPNHDYKQHISQVYGGHTHARGFIPEDADPNRFQLPAFIDPNWLIDAEYAPMMTVNPQPGFDLHFVQAPHYPETFYGLTFYPPEEIRLDVVRVTEGATGFTYLSESILVPEPLTIALLAIALPFRIRGARRP